MTPIEVEHGRGTNLSIRTHCETAQEFIPKATHLWVKNHKCSKWDKDQTSLLKWKTLYLIFVSCFWRLPKLSHQQTPLELESRPVSPIQLARATSGCLQSLSVRQSLFLSSTHAQTLSPASSVCVDVCPHTCVLSQIRICWVSIEHYLWDILTQFQA